MGKISIFAGVIVLAGFQSAIAATKLTCNYEGKSEWSMSLKDKLNVDDSIIITNESFGNQLFKVTATEKSSVQEMYVLENPQLFFQVDRKFTLVRVQNKWSLDRLYMSNPMAGYQGSEPASGILRADCEQQ